MSDITDLSNKRCLPCDGGMASLPLAEAKILMQSLHPDWQLSEDHTIITRRFEFKGFAKAVYTANLVVYLADQEGHHPDIHFGWGYCAVSFTTHDTGGLTENDFICAQKLDRMTG
jgi:4a-hydroxytetrahydrobiopterin dehydratase